MLERALADKYNEYRWTSSAMAEGALLCDQMNHRFRLRLKKAQEDAERLALENYRRKYDKNMWYEEARDEATELINGLAQHVLDSHAVVLMKQAERCARADAFVYPQIRIADNHRRRYRRARKAAFESSKVCEKLKWMFPE